MFAKIISNKQQQITGNVTHTLNIVPHIQLGSINNSHSLGRFVGKYRKWNQFYRIMVTRLSNRIRDGDICTNHIILIRTDVETRRWNVEVRETVPQSGSSYSNPSAAIVNVGNYKKANLPVSPACHPNEWRQDEQL